MGRIDRAKRDRLAANTLARLGVQIEPHTPVRTLTAPERAEVAIARAMRDHANGSGLIILDESTRALSGDDLLRINHLLRRIAGEGSAALVIGHNLTELMAITDRMTILRDGRLAGAGLLTSELSEQEIARRMLGGALGATQARSATPPPGAVPGIRVMGLTGTSVANVTFSLGQQEILGITGLPGNGYEEIPYLLTGAQPAAAGLIHIGTRSLDLTRCGVRGCLRSGIVLVPERRDRDGLAFELNVRDNISLPGLRRRGSTLFVGRKWQREDAEAAVEQLGIRPHSPTTLVKQLSGGNQQKVLLAKWLTLGPAVLVLHEPTQAVDVAARQDILHALRRAADAGVAVVLVSSEPDDLVAACDRVLIYGAGTGMRAGDATTPDALIKDIYGARGAPQSVAATGSAP